MNDGRSTLWLLPFFFAQAVEFVIAYSNTLAKDRKFANTDIFSEKVWNFS